VIDVTLFASVADYYAKTELRRIPPQSKVGPVPFAGLVIETVLSIQRNAAYRASPSPDENSVRAGLDPLRFQDPTNQCLQARLRKGATFAMPVRDVFADPGVISAGTRLRADGKHSFLPVRATVQVFGGSLFIFLTSPSAFALDMLVRIGDRTFLVELAPDGGGGSAGNLMIPAELSLPTSVSLLACLRPGEEQ
jgi:hypothetical protein